MTPEIILETLKSKKHNQHYLNRYYKFIIHVMSTDPQREKYTTSNHHILPKAPDLFPEFKNLTLNKWNSVHLTHRQHFIAHHLLWKAYGGSMTLAFNWMNNSGSTQSSSKYKLLQDEARQILSVKQTAALKIKHPRGMLGKTHSSATCENYSTVRSGMNNSMYGKLHTSQSREQMSTKRKAIVSCKEIITGKFVKVSKEEYDLNQHLYAGINKGNKNPGNNAGFVTARNLKTSLIERVEKDTFDKLKGILYVGQRARNFTSSLF